MLWVYGRRFSRLLLKNNISKNIAYGGIVLGVHTILLLLINIIPMNTLFIMGIASRILYDKHIDNNCVGVYNVTFYKQIGEALKIDNELKQKISANYLQWQIVWRIYVVISNKQRY